MDHIGKKKIAKNTIYLYIRALISLLITLYTSRIVLKELGVEDYGIFVVVSGISSFMTVVSGTLSHAMCRFMSHEYDKSIERRIHVFCTCFNLTILSLVLCVLLFETIGIWFLNDILNIPQQRIFAANISFQCGVIVFLLGLINIPYNSAIITNEDMGVFAYVTLVDVFLKLLVAIILFIAENDKLIIYSVLLIIQALIVRLIYVIISHKRYPECKIRFVWDAALIKSMAVFIGWTFIGSITFVLRESGVNFLLNIFCGPAVNAARGVSSQVTNNISLFGDNFLQATVPQTIKLYAANDIPSMHELICNSCRYCLILLLLLSLPVLCYTDFILNLWLVEVPDLTTSFIKIILLYCIVSIVSKPLETAIRATGRIKKYVITYSLIEFLNIPVSWTLLAWGYTPISTVIVILTLGICGVICRIYFCIMYTHMSLKYVLNEIGIRFFLMFLFCIMTYYIFTEYIVVNGSLIRFGLNITLLTVINTIFVSVVCIKKNERILVLKKIRSVIFP